MNYSEIKALALSFTDRTDAQTENNVDGFLRMVESRVNRKIRTMDMSTEVDIPIVADQEGYALPAGYGGSRQIKWVDGGARKTITLVTPEKLDSMANIPDGQVVGDLSQNEISGYIDDDQIKIWPTQSSGNINMLYYMKVPVLDDVDTTNWLSDDYPDCYVFGLCVEISAFVKDEEAKSAWDVRFKEALLEIKIEDKHNRWSGAPMQMQTA